MTSLNRATIWVLMIAGLLNVVAFIGACTSSKARDTTGVAADVISTISGPVGDALRAMSHRFADVEARQKSTSEKMSWQEWLYGITGIGLTASTVHSKVTSRKRTKSMATGLVHALSLSKEHASAIQITQSLITKGVPVDVKELRVLGVVS
jgi:hypothetical protein